jgi:hypothetical protein
LAICESPLRHNSELGRENIALQQLLNKSALFTQAEFRMIMMCLHPDNSASAGVRARAFDLVRQKEKRLVRQK